jgi:hypothetical protein
LTEQPMTSTPAPTRRQRIADVVVGICTVLMIVGLIDPLEGMFLIAAAGAAVLVVAFVRRSRARWLIIAGLAVVAVTFLVMAGGEAVLPPAVVPLAIVPWLVGGLLIIAGDVVALREVLGRRPRLANAVAAVLVVLVALLMLRVVILLSQYRASANMPGTGRASAMICSTRDDDRPLMHAAKSRGSRATSLVVA